ncbi:Transcriptional regulator containing PAS, AAA-type ATPase, and DNA-binding Fis domains [Dethiosulfatibacter aminovorans DSM 17477]|uniref:Transcriptional regulator containing PAS, AAA-type ATPase, and DNA-binding Fis domains n=1 Tax=Dethiosulfatibacter aminovorans DSM 17477 TaxID=1121476 RepID=A0A1M6AFZ7_9FIRM|nr:sigma 54-interacting transcriptional regulator [Dethiosulfatibacter aminovorans]SHI35342.1 Transcriptional regulator containing PAS, AAA-type ATPase, and DNA-binding Fis domains [Dethiosulfatibacter aminovorans DSM 17477]
METKHILMLTMNHSAGEFYRKTLFELFPANSIDVVVHTPSSYAQEKDLSLIDLYLVSRFAIASGSDLQYSIPFGVPVVDLKVDYKEDTIRDLRNIKKGTKCLMVNENENSCMDSIINLRHRRIHNIAFYPYAPGMDLLEDIDFAVTPGEPHLVPKSVTKVIDLGYRYLTPRTILEVALKLDIENIFEGKNYNDYSEQFPSNDYNSSILYQKTSQLEIWLNKLMELMDTGVVGIDEYNRIFCINKKARDILNIDSQKEREKHYKTILPFINFENGRNNRLNMTNKIVNHENTDMMVTVHPIEIDLKFRGHFVIIERFMEMENKQQKARLQILQKGHQAKYYFSDILSNSEKMAATCQLAKKMAKTSSAILITGESGTGKELLASAIHNASSRSVHPYIAINCAAMPENLLESELFGYEGGAFTGAKKSGKLGLFEYAHKGTLFLDEIEDMSPSLQVKLLRVLQEKEVMRVGGHKIIDVDVRVIAATNMNMERMVKEGAIRKDLYYRLNTLQLELPPLRERVEDIPLLADHFMSKKKIAAQLADDVYEAFKSHPWDGNIRELENCIEYFQCLDKDVITRDDLPKSFKIGGLDSRTVSVEDSEPKKTVGLVFPERPDTLLFILETIYRFNCINKSIGRRSLQKEAEKVSVYLPESEIRRVMKKLEEKQWIEIRRGRGGAKVTDEGIEYLKSIE